MYFPYDPSPAKRGDLVGTADTVVNLRRPDLMANKIAEPYICAPDGTISVVIENMSRGYARTYSLGALR